MLPPNHNPNKFFSAPGSRYKTEYAGSLEKDGSITLEKVGEIDLWEMHDAAADACDINNIYARFCNGDISVLARRQGNLGDVTGMPSSLRESLDLVRAAEDVYNRLPPDLKEQYPTFEAFTQDVGSSKLISFLSQESASATAGAVGEVLSREKEQTE